MCRNFCFSPDDRRHCLNALLILEHDLTALIRQERLVFHTGRKVTFWPRTDLCPYTLYLESVDDPKVSPKSE